MGRLPFLHCETHHKASYNKDSMVLAEGHRQRPAEQNSGSGNKHIYAPLIFYNGAKTTL